MATKKSNDPKNMPTTFEEGMAELTRLVTSMEAGELPLEASLTAYARGAELVQFCATQLDKVEQQVKILEGDLIKPFGANANDTNEFGASLPQ